MEKRQAPIMKYRRKVRIRAAAIHLVLLIMTTAFAVLLIQLTVNYATIRKDDVVLMHEFCIEQGFPYVGVVEREGKQICFVCERIEEKYSNTTVTNSYRICAG